MRTLLAAAFAFLVATHVFGQTTNLYTKPVPGAPGGITGYVDKELTHAIALFRGDRKQCFRAELSDGGKTFKLTGLPTGKYDLMLVTKAGGIYEGLGLGEVAKLTGDQMNNMDTRIKKADNFFNLYKLHRFGVEEDGQVAVLFIERLRDKFIYKQDGTQLMSNLRRLEVATFNKATNDWDFAVSRHLYREEAPIGAGMGFFPCKHLEALGNLRIIDSVKDLGSIVLP